MVKVKYIKVYIYFVYNNGMTKKFQVTTTTTTITTIIAQNYQFLSSKVTFSCVSGVSCVSSKMDA